MYISLTQKDRGFTLIEIMVVIAIIGMLGAVVMAQLNSARIRSRDQARVSTLKQVQIALALSFEENKIYPGTGNNTWYDMECDDDTDPDAVGSGYNNFSTIMGAPYMTETPGPIGATCLWYQRRNNGAGYKIMFQPEKLDVLTSDQDCFSPSGWYCLGDNW